MDSAPYLGGVTPQTPKFSGERLSKRTASISERREGAFGRTLAEWNVFVHCLLVH
jgi:hypothetical protein